MVQATHIPYNHQNMLQSVTNGKTFTLMM